MIFSETKLQGAFIVEPELHWDERGFFARTWCQKEFERTGLKTGLVQCNISFNSTRGTLRGMHYQSRPYAEAKLVRCTMGAIYDVIIDLRPESATFKEWISVELTASNRRMLFVPEGTAHGFLTLMDDTEVFYQMANFFSPDHAHGVRWNDPAFRIDWPESPRVISIKDQEYSDFSE